MRWRSTAFERAPRRAFAALAAAALLGAAHPAPAPKGHPKKPGRPVHTVVFRLECDGVNDGEYAFASGFDARAGTPGAAKLVLRRAFATADLIRWHELATTGKPQTMDCTLEKVRDAQIVLARYGVRSAHPVAYDAKPPNDAGHVIVSKVVFATAGITPEPVAAAPVVR